MNTPSRFRPLTADRWPRRRWALVLVTCVTMLLAAGLVGYLAVDAERISTDSALFQHTGWYMTQGAIPYVDVWDVNPPLTFLIAAGLALLTGGNMVALHVASVALTVVAVLAGVVLTGWVAFDVTGDDAAAVAAGLVVLAVPEMYGLVGYGIRSQYFAFAFGALALALVRRDRPAWAGASAAASAGVWQPGGGLALLVVGIAGQRGGRRTALAAVGGGLALATLVVVPFAAAGAVVPMVVQVVVAPVVGGEPYTLVERGYQLLLTMGYAVVVLPIGLLGWIRAARDRSSEWWIPAGGVLFSLMLAVVNFNGSLDAALWLLFAGLGVALVVAKLPAGWRWRVVAGLAVLVAVAPVWSVVPATPLKSPVEAGAERAEPETVPALVETQSSVPPMWKIYWQQRIPERCHYRLSWTELRWIATTPADLDAEECGRWYTERGWDGGVLSAVTL